MRKITLTTLYLRQLIRVGTVTCFHQTLGEIPYSSDPANEPDILVHCKRKDGTLSYDVLLLCSVAYAAKVNPSDNGNHYWKVTLRFRYEIAEI